MGENNFKEKLKLARSLVYAGAVIILSIPAIQYIFSTRPKRPVREPIEYSRPLDFNRSIDFQPLDINDVRSFGSEPLDFELPEVPAIEPVILDLPTNNITSVLRKGLQGDVVFDSNEYTGIETLVSGNNAFFVSNGAVSVGGEARLLVELVNNLDEGALTLGLDTLCLFDAHNRKAIALPKFLGEVSNNNYECPIGSKVLAVADNGSCVYGLYEGNPENLIAGVVADYEGKKAHLFFKSAEKEWDFDNFWISLDGKTCRLMTDKVVILYDTGSLEPIKSGYGIREAISSDGKVVIYRYDNHQVSSMIKGSTYFIYDENHHGVFPFSTSVGGDKMDFKLSENGKAMIQIQQHPNGTWYLQAFRADSQGYEDGMHISGFTPNEIEKVGNDGTIYVAGKSIEFLPGHPGKRAEYLRNKR